MKRGIINAQRPCGLETIGWELLNPTWAETSGAMLRAKLFAHSTPDTSSDFLAAWQEFAFSKHFPLPETQKVEGLCLYQINTFFLKFWLKNYTRTLIKLLTCSLPNMLLSYFRLPQHHHHHYSHSEEYHTESSRGSDLSDIMEEDEEDLYSEMQLEEGRRRSINSHNTLKVHTAQWWPRGG